MASSGSPVLNQLLATIGAVGGGAAAASASASSGAAAAAAAAGGAGASVQQGGAASAGGGGGSSAASPSFDMLHQHILNPIQDKDSLVTLISHLRDNEQVLKDNKQNVSTLLNNLSNATHSAVIAVLLRSQMRHMDDNADRNAVFRYVTNFLKDCDATQIKLVAREFYSICSRYSEMAMQLPQGLRALPALKAAIGKLQPAPHVLTPIHPEFLKVCLKLKHYTYAVDVIEVPILDLKPKQTCLYVEDFLLYFYYGAMIHIGLKEYPRAIQFLNLVLCCPGTCVSAIQIDAWKKLVLVHLIEHGEGPQTPKSSPALSRAIAPSSGHHNYRSQSSGAVGLSPYNDIIDAFKSKDTVKMARVLSGPSSVDILNRDQNMGLAKQCSAALHRRMIVNLTSTYLTLSLDDIRQRVHLQSVDEAETMVFDMITRGQINAVIDHSSNHVIFSEGDTDEDSTKDSGEGVLTQQQMDAQAKQMIDIGEMIRKLDIQIAVDPHFLKRKEGGERGGGALFDDEREFGFGRSRAMRYGPSRVDTMRNASRKNVMPMQGRLRREGAPLPREGAPSQRRFRQPAIKERDRDRDNRDGRTMGMDVDNDMEMGDEDDDEEGADEDELNGEEETPRSGVKRPYQQRLANDDMDVLPAGREHDPMENGVDAIEEEEGHHDNGNNDGDTGGGGARDKHQRDQVR
mmetsp:Transcript_18168/g.51685  ORF Transcript_18168/g.51685 Transcript_18168/m.51685 type:complete len:684 (-) Transcript_18168:832-2883(-)